MSFRQTLRSSFSKPSRWVMAPEAALITAGMVLGLAAAFFVARESWYLAIGCALILPVAIIFVRYPFAAIFVWILIDPFLMTTLSPADRQVYWVIHRAMPPVTLGVILITALPRVGHRHLPRLTWFEAAVPTYWVVSQLSILLTNSDLLATTYLLYDRVLIPICLYLIVRLSAPTEKDLLRLIPVAFFVCATQAGIGVLSWIAPGILPAEWSNLVGARATGSLYYPSVYGTTLIFFGLYLFHGAQVLRQAWLKALCLAGFSMALLGIFISFARASWLAGAIVLAGLALIYPRPALRYSLIAAPAALILGLSFFAPYLVYAQVRLNEEQSALSRLPVYLAGVRMFAARPIFGFGYGNFDLYDMQFQERVADLINVEEDHASHSLYLTVAAEQGMIGLLTFLGAPLGWLLISIKAYKRLPRDGILSRKLLVILWLVLLNHFIENNFANMRVVFGLGMWWLTLGLIASLASVGLDRGRRMAPFWVRHAASPPVYPAAPTPAIAAGVPPALSAGMAQPRRIPAALRHAALPAVAELIDALNQGGVRYCHWKSNPRLTDGLQGLTDLDLLIDPADRPRLRAILNAAGVIPVEMPTWRRYPDVENYLGLDPGSSRFIHLHVHYRLILGERYAKNYRLPLESQFLIGARPAFGVPIPEPGLELAVLCARTLLKYRDRDAIKDALGIRSPGIPARTLHEIAALRSQTDAAGLELALEGTADVIPPELIRAFLALIEANPRSGLRLYGLRLRLLHALRRYRRTSGAASAWRYFSGLRREHSAPRMTLPGRGIALAVIGVDGAGKSTNCQALAAWLGARFVTRSFYMGSKQPSRRTRLTYWSFRAARRGQRECARLTGAASLPARGLAALRDAALYTHQVYTAADRCRRFEGARRVVAAGGIALFDRYPLEDPLDGPQIPEAAAGGNLLARHLYRAERAIYQRILPPDAYLFLEANADVSLQRKPDHQPAAIAEKARRVEEIVERAVDRAPDTRLVRVDACQPLEAVRNDLQAAVWDLFIQRSSGGMR